jgi:predicted MFS family arabinose efflux permease
VVPELHGVLVLVLVSTGGISLAYTGVAARAQVAGHPAAAGWIEAAVAVGSVAGGMLWGRRRHRRGHHAHLAGLVALLGVGIGVAGLTPGLGGLGLVMGATGVAVAPLFVVAYLAVDDRAPEDRRTEASTWVNTFGNVGGALGSAVAGVLVQHVTVTAPFEVGAVVLLCASVAATGFGGRDTPRAPLSGG